MFNVKFVVVFVVVVLMLGVVFVEIEIIWWYVMGG